ncbi:MAG: hypothetical protein KGJ06_04510 [Pseudomonadota bacterium]|nr:hypothetical protein [Pseudomonadota bacterium]
MTDTPKLPSFIETIKQSAGGKLQPADFEQMGHFKQTTARISGNVGQGGWIGNRGLAIGGVVATAWFGSGLIADTGRLIGVVPLKQDEQGQDLPVNFGNVVIDGLGTAGSLYLAAKGGGNRAMGI